MVAALLQASKTQRGELVKSVVSAKEGYRLWAATYDDDPNPLLALEERGVFPMLPGLRGKDALDVGCGTGRWLQTFLSLGARSALGVDSSAEMMGRAGEKPALRNRLVLGDCLALPLRARVADVVVCSFIVSHVLNLRAFAGELSRVSRLHADVFITEMHPEAQSSGWRCAFRRGNKTVEISEFAHAPADLRKTFESEGFKLVMCRDLRLGEPERCIFAKAEKGHLFEAACSLPAVLVLQFRLTA
jgi:malonyl-CoA O-methyltransferase